MDSYCDSIEQRFYSCITDFCFMITLNVHCIYQYGFQFYFMPYVFILYYTPYDAQIMFGGKSHMYMYWVKILSISQRTRKRHK